MAFVVRPGDQIRMPSTGVYSHAQSSSILRGNVDRRSLLDLSWLFRNVNPYGYRPNHSQEKMTAQMREMAEKNQQKAREMENKKKAEDTTKEGTGKPKTDAGKGDGKDK